MSGYYHQGDRDAAAAYGCLVLLGLAVVCVILIVAALLWTWQP